MKETTMSRKLWITTGTLGVISIFAGTGLAMADSGDERVAPGLERHADSAQSTQSAQSARSAADTQSAQTAVSSTLR